MITILTWVALVAGGILILLMLLSLLGGLDLDVDIGSTEVDGDGGGIGLIKGVLTFTSVASWFMKVFLVSTKNPYLAGALGVIIGTIAFFLMSYLFKLMLEQDENVNWSVTDSLFSNGEVYLRIPPGGSGLINVNIKGTKRELKAKSTSEVEIKTGAKVRIVETEGEFAIVELESNQSK